MMTKVERTLDKLQDGIVSALYKALRAALSLLIAFFAARCSFAEDFSPFAPILLSSAPALGLNATFCYLGAAAGYLTVPFSISCFKYITALTLIYLVYMVFHRPAALFRSDTAVLSGAACFLAGIIFQTVTGITLFSVLLLCVESLLVSCCVYFTVYAARSVRRAEGLSTREVIALSVTLVLLLTAAKNFTLFQLNLAHLIGLTLIFLTLFCLKTGHAAVFGCLIGMVLSALSGGDEAIFTAVSVSTLVAAAFAGFSPRLSLTGFLLVYNAVLFFYGKFPWNYPLFAEPVAALIPILPIPKKKLRRLLSSYIPVRSEGAAAAVPKNMKEACRAACKKNCPRARVCYLKNSKKLQTALEAAEEITPDTLSFCTRPNELRAVIYRCQAAQAIDELTQLTDDLDRLSEEMDKRIRFCESPPEFFPAEEKRISAQLAGRGFTVHEISCYADRNRRKFCELRATVSGDLLIEKIIRESVLPFLGSGASLQICGDPPEIRARAAEGCAYGIRCAALSKTKRGEEISGDSAVGFSAGKDTYYLILADGMGSGKEAGVQSALMIDTVRKLVCGGMSVPAAFHVFRAAARLRVETGFSTADVCKINLENGTAEFYKSGAFDSFYLHSARLATVRGGGMPLGLGDRDCVKRSKITLQNGDYLIMGTDGLSALGDDIEKELIDCAAEDARDYAQRILRRLSQQTGADGDDVTVMVCKMEKSAE